MSERACNEAIANMYNDLTEIRGQYNDLKNEIVEISTNIKWMREGIEKINDNLSKCAACKNPEEIIEKIEKNKSTIGEVRDEVHAITNKAIGISVGIGIVVTIIGIVIKLL